jgi:hypothetical protein
MVTFWFNFNSGGHVDLEFVRNSSQNLVVTIWKKGSYLYTTTFDDYVQSFKQNS